MKKTLKKTKKSAPLELIHDHHQSFALERIADALESIADLLKGKHFPEIVAEKENPSFPVWRMITIGGSSKDALLEEMEKKDVYVSDWAKELLDNGEFTIGEKKEEINLVRLSVKDLGFDNGATTDQIYQAAEKFGLELCPAETGPQLRLQLTDQATSDYFWVGMKQITDRDGNPHVFRLDRDGDGRLRLDASYAGPAWRWDAGVRFVFRLRKKL